MSRSSSPKAVSDLFTVAKGPSTGKSNWTDAVNVACGLGWVPIVAIVCFWRTPGERTSCTVPFAIARVGRGRAGQVENRKQVCQADGRVDGCHLLLAALRVVLGGAKVVAGLVSISREPRTRWILSANHFGEASDGAETPVGSSHSQVSQLNAPSIACCTLQLAQCTGSRS